MDASTSLLGVFAFTSLPEYHAVPALWSITGLAPAGSRPWNLCNFLSGRREKSAKVENRRRVLKSRSIGGMTEHTWRMGFSFPSNSFSKMRSKCNPIIKHEKIPDSWRVMASSHRPKPIRQGYCPKSVGQGYPCPSAQTELVINKQRICIQFAFLV